MKPFKEDLPKGFDAPTALPQTPEQAKRWQDANRSWWESHPMRYDWREEIKAQEFSPEFYAEIDRRFFANAREYLPGRRLPFDALIDFDALRGKDVLEIGVGSGSHAQLLASHAKSFTGIDLTEYAIKSTTARFAGAGLKGRVERMDAEKMTFADGSFDFIWSWGVIHHSANTRSILSEMRRVLRPGGTACVMVYYRNWWNHYVVAGFLRGVLAGDLIRIGSAHKIMQLRIDGGIARFYTDAEWRALAGEFFDIDDVRIVGNKAQVVPLPPGRLKNALLNAVPDGASRFLTNTCRMGTFLVSTMRKKAS